MKTIRIRVEYDHEYIPEGCDGKPLPEPQETYEDNKYIRPDGGPMSYDEYLRTYGNPDNYTGYIVTRQERCKCCGTWIDKDSLGADLYQEYVAEGMYKPDDPKLAPLADVVTQVMP